MTRTIYIKYYNTYYILYFSLNYKNIKFIVNKAKLLKLLYY